MTRLAACLTALTAAMACGCADKAKVNAADARPCNAKGADGLELRFCLERRDLFTGETIPVTVTAINVTKEPLRIDSPSGAPVLIRVIRHTSLYSEEVKSYPQSATTNLLSWVLPAGGSRTFTLAVPVEPDWPVEEILHLTGELNGYPNVSPGLAVMVHQAKE
jgi:hypothetical protein